MTKRRGKPAKIAKNLAKTILQFIQGRRYAPANLQELMHQLAIPDLHREVFQEVLDGLVSDRQLDLQREKYVLPTKSALVSGTISVHPKGFGFVKQPEGPDIFIPKHAVMDAVDGDEVEVEVNPIVSAKGPEGGVIAILKRSRTHLAGIVLRKTAHHYSAYAPILGPDKPFLVTSKEKTLQEGDRIICKVTSWNNESELVEAEVSRVIGHISDPSIDILAAIEEFELPDGFTKEAIAEAKKFGEKIPLSEIKKRHDLSEMECVTIDPDTAKDYDDAITLVKDEKGHFLLGVHIADVAYYVKPGSHLDGEALLRCNSTYFPGKCVPMLPEELSNELCSLKPNVKRLTQSIFVEFDPQGNLVDYQIERSVIKSKKRFTYKEALAILEKKKKSPLAPLLDRMVELCHLLKKKRFERGSIDFAMTDEVLLVDEKGVPTKIEKVEYDITHQMIEEFMLKANEIAAIHLEKKKKPLIYRVHEQPSAESFQDFFLFARSLGFFLPPNPNHRDIQKLFLDAKDSPLLQTLSIQFIRSLRIAAYSTENIGHYGLALEHYCHFTSPIRRYTDLIIQRLLFNELPDSTDVQGVATACSEKERISFRAESSVKLLKKLRLAKAYFEVDPSQIYEATITRVKPFALFFEVSQFDLESTLHVSQIGNDYYEFDAARLAFHGRHTGRSFITGQKIFVRLENIDLALRQSVWAMVPPPSTSAPKKKKR